jgi:hypothetical protein
MVFEDMKNGKSKFAFVLLLIVAIGLTYLLYRLLRFENETIGDMEIDNLGDLLSYIVVWLGHLCSIFNILLYVALFAVWKYTFTCAEELFDFGDNDTKTGVDEYESQRHGEKLWESMNDGSADDPGVW